MNKPQVVKAEFAGEEHRILLCLWGLHIAEARHGFDISGIETDREEAEERQGDMKAMLEFLWLGMLPFQEDLELKELGMAITFGDMPAVSEAFQEVIQKQLGKEVRQAIERKRNGEDGEEEPEGAEGKDST